MFSKLSNVKYPTYTQKIDRRSNEKIENIYFSFQNANDHIMLNTPITEVIFGQSPKILAMFDLWRKEAYGLFTSSVKKSLQVPYARHYNPLSI